MIKNGLFVINFLLIFNTYCLAGQIALPKTGQTKCYDASGNEISCTGTGQDGDLQEGVSWPYYRFSLSGECVTDSLTGLVWAKNANIPNGSMTWQEALNFINSINAGEGLCGFKDWRLPNIRELLSLVNYDKSGADPLHWLNSEGFENVIGFLYWSSTTAEDNYGTLKSRAWDVFDWGVINHNPKTESFFVWPIRSSSSGICKIQKTGQTKCYDASGVEISCTGTGQDGDLQEGVSWPNPRFIVYKNGTVTDALTGLLWAQDIDTFGPAECGSAKDKNWQESLDYIKCLNTRNYLGYSNWRLPNIIELLSLIDFSENNPALPAGHPFGDINCNQYIWSSTTCIDSPVTSWTVEIPHGWTFFRKNKSDLLAVWPVHSEIDDPKKATITPAIHILLHYD
jgi:hypothetical protein